MKGIVTIIVVISKRPCNRSRKCGELMSSSCENLASIRKVKEILLTLNEPLRHIAITQHSLL